MQTNPQQTSVSITLRWMTNDSNAQLGRWESEEHREWQACFFWGGWSGLGWVGLGLGRVVGGGVFSGGQSSRFPYMLASIYCVPEIISGISQLLRRTKRTVVWSLPETHLALPTPVQHLCILHRAIYNHWSITHRLEEKKDMSCNSKKSLISYGVSVFLHN